MLQIRDICKEYRTGDLVQRALDHVSLNLRDNEFVAILGPSGSGKTTLLNIIGGLDRYDSGDLIINGVSTKKYKDRDWDAYRNHTIGFVFQSYNLIMHQSVLANVELALTISGISGAERRQRAEEALRKVGLGEQMHKRPAQMSGGQMQRVAIARALVNNPDIVLADEPTGALDSETSIQVMDLLKEVAKDRLVVMVTHNPELAQKYATRIVTIQDGKIRNDSDPFIVPEEEEKEPVHKRLGKASMSFLTALSLSFNNLRTKKARTILVSFAGSIGIIGIALILALSTGANNYIQTQEAETLSQYPLQIQQQGYDLTDLMESRSSGGNLLGRKETKDEDKVGVQNVVNELFSGVSTNDLKSLKTYLDSGRSDIGEYVNGIEYDYNVTPRIYRMDTEGDKVFQMNPNNLFTSLATGEIDVSSMMSGTLGASYITSLPVSAALYEDTYDVKAGHWPENDHQLVLVLTQGGKVSDLLLYELGLRDETVLEEKIKNLSSGGEEENPDNDTDTGAAVTSDEKENTAGSSSVSSESSGGDEETYSYNDFLGRKFKLVKNSDLYQYDSQMKVWTDKSEDENVLRQLVKNGQDLEIVGIVQPKEDSTTSALTPGLAYPHGLITDLIQADAQSQIVKEQLADPEVNVLTGNKFSEDNQNQGFDLSSLFSVDTDAIQKAFQVNTSDLNTGNLAGQMNMDDLDLSGIDLSQMNLSQMVDVNAILGQLPTLGTDQLRSVLSGIRVNDTKDQIQKIFASFLSGFQKYSAADTATDFSRFGESLKGYLESDSFRNILTQNMQTIWQTNADSAISEDDLRQMMESVYASYLTYAEQNNLDPTGPENFTGYLSSPDSGAAAVISSAAETIREKVKGIEISEEQMTGIRDALMQGYETYAAENGGPALSAITAAFSQYMETPDAQQLLSDAADSIVDTGAIETAIQSAVSQTMSSVASGLQQQVQAAVGTIMTNVSGQLQSVLEQAMQNMMQSVSGNIQDMFKIDPSALSSAIKMNMNAEQIQSLMTSMVSGKTNSYEDNLSNFGYADPDTPSGILIYSKNFDAKNQVVSILDNYNQKMRDEGHEDRVIRYTDMVAAMMSSVTRIINAISYILIGFVGISLVVSSIMIGVITYISVLERRKEIGILRAMGASKNNVAQVFNAETFITGILAGLIGVAVTVILTFPANYLIRRISGISGIRAFLPPQAALLLILLSVLLTMVAGLIPAGKAAKSDPVTALRTE